MQNKSVKKYRDLIYDVGMHRGEDTEFYLKKGFRVVAFEANPNLVKSCKKKFEEEINNNKLTIIEGAIVDPTLSDSDSIKFYQNENSVWGTVVEEWSKRNESLGTKSKIIEVPVLNFENIIKKYGIPYYMKIDIEGMDMFCLQTLRNFSNKPSYVSVESEKISFQKLKSELDLLNELGYSQFKIVNQARIEEQNEPINNGENNYLNYTFVEGASGLFGKDLPESWLGYQLALKKYKNIFYQYKLIGDNGLLNKTLLTRIGLRKFKSLYGRPIPGWYDTHAKHDSID